MKALFQKYLCKDRFSDYRPLTSRERRTVFQQDHDRIVFSTAFRRLQNKTQVFSLPTEKVFVHNRLTHSIEVESVGRSLGIDTACGLLDRYPELNEVVSVHEVGSVVSAACLAHDLGNPPFGHFGEATICSYFKEGNGMQYRDLMSPEMWNDFTHFDGNANTFRLLVNHFNGKSIGGFDLSYATLASIIKYPFESALAGDKPKFGFFNEEREAFLQVAERTGMLQISSSPIRYSRHPFAYLVEAADDICYQIMDLEDAYKMQIVQFDEIVNIYSSFLDADTIPELNKQIDFQMISDKNSYVAILRGKVIGYLERSCASVFIDRFEDISKGVYIGSLISNLPECVRSAYYRLVDFSEERIYKYRDSNDVSLKGYQVLTVLLDKFIHAALHPKALYSQKLLNKVSDQFSVGPAYSEGERIHGVIDYISGITDLYAVDLYNMLS